MTQENTTSSGEGITSGKSIDVNSLPEASTSSKNIVQDIPLGLPTSSENFRKLKRNAEQSSLCDEATQVDEDEE